LTSCEGFKINGQIHHLVVNTLSTNESLMKLPNKSLQRIVRAGRPHNL
jgi:hypothetical protein